VLDDLTADRKRRGAAGRHPAPRKVGKKGKERLKIEPIYLPLISEKRGGKVYGGLELSLESLWTRSESARFEWRVGSSDYGKKKKGKTSIDSNPS